MISQILVFNSGSSSFKFSLYQSDQSEPILAGLAEQLGSQQACISFEYKQNKQKFKTPNSNHEAAINFVLDQFKTLNIDTSLIKAIGHRVVHGGEFYNDSVIVNDEVLNNLESCSDLAPLHNPANIQGIKIMQNLFKDIPQIAVFDTAFHQTLPKHAYLYAVDYNWYKDYAVRRYGFHGTSHKYVAQQAKTILKLDDKHQLITIHLGNGCSACAIKDGKSVDTTMGMTPLEGLVMGTRCGDIDPSILQFIANKTNLSLDEITTKLNKQSGLLGLSGLSNDMRTLIAASATNPQAKIAIDVFCFKLAKQIMALATSLSKIDVLVFTGGIGENSAFIREEVLEHLVLLGYKVETEFNNHQKLYNGQITKANTPLAMVIKTDEELMIKNDTTRLIFSN
ncbi:MAG: acetate kinase [Saccharospirillaceae bacterium]|nr:acetate kinase [Pseudomonadales bacterium]NRB78344.1 acetate kinase [Saccharospirillaceae bacterium]